MHRRQVIADLVKGHGWSLGAELGLWDGRTYLWLLEECPALTLIGVDAWIPQGGYQGIDRDGNNWDHKKHERMVRDGAEEYGERAIIIKNDTVKAADGIDDGTLDFVFIDADHSTLGVMGDIEAWRPKLKKTGVLMGHDIDWQSVQDALYAEDILYEILSDNVWMECKTLS